MFKEDKNFSIGDYDTIMSDRNIFNQIVYTPLSDALRLLEERQKDPELMAKVEKLLNGNIPEIFKNNRCGIMARQLATPNHESRMFISIAQENGLHPVFLEYFEDKLTSNNKYKHSLAQINIINNFENKEIEKIKIVDFNKYDGKKIIDVETLNGELLINFHKKLFEAYDMKEYSFINELDWYKKEKNETPLEFYVKLFILISCFGILFENFLFLKSEIESDFTKKIVLPSLEKVLNLTGVKPLIVPINPFDLEIDNFWYCHLPIIKKFI